MNTLKYFCVMVVMLTAVSCQAAVAPTVTATAVPPTATATTSPTASPLPLPERPEPEPIETPTPEADEGETESDEDTAVSQVMPGEPFRLMMGETAVLAKTAITFREVSEDSRCPKSVECFWEGQGIVELDITAPEGQTTRMQLNTNSPDDIRAYQQYEIQLIELTPYPQTTDIIPQEMYEAVLIINEASE